MCSQLAVVELVVIDYLVKAFPDATSGQLSWARLRAICNPALACVAVKKLSLHKYLLANSVHLSKDVGKYVEIINAASYEDFIKDGWKYDPPKALGDILESLFGAILVDTGYDYAATSKVVEGILEDVLCILHPRMARDPVTELIIWAAKAGCAKIKFE